jgi:SHS family lactate transporter-like MFS transporter
MLHLLRSLAPNQRRAVIASYLGWTLDAFDFFILVFVLKDVAQEFHTVVETVTYAIFLTLAARPVGALLFGLAADRFGRRPVLTINILLFSMLEFASGLAPSLTSFLILRLAFGVAMGGEWGVGAALAMETIPPGTRGVVSGILQTGYPSGYLLAAMTYFALYGLIGWRGMFMVGALPALLVLYIRRHVPESPGWNAASAHQGNILTVLGKHWPMAIYGILLMTAFNFFSHGTQDIYPRFLKGQHGFSTHETATVAIIYNIGAIVGGWTFGIWSQTLGRRRTIMIAAILSLPVVYLWAFSTTMVGLATGAFLMQVCVQGAWGVIPAHLNELSPPDARATFPGTIYQLGNFIASYNAVLQTTIAQKQGGNYAFALASVAVAAAVAIVVLTAVGREARDAKLIATG